MPKVRVHEETPSQAVVKAAQAATTLTDATGRTLTVRNLTALDRLRMLQVIGAENQMYMGYASLAFHVTAVDGVDEPRPGNLLGVEALVQRLGDEGLNAVAEWLAGQDRKAETEDSLKN